MWIVAGEAKGPGLEFGVWSLAAWTQTPHRGSKSLIETLNPNQHFLKERREIPTGGLPQQRAVVGETRGLGGPEPQAGVRGRF